MIQDLKTQGGQQGQENHPHQAKNLKIQDPEPQIIQQDHPRQ